VKKWLVIICVLVIVGCAGKVTKLPPIPTAKVAPIPSVPPAALLPTKLMGCAWEYGEMEPGLYFEVWSSTNLVHWVLATNTTEKIARFPMKPCEFWKVRARDTNGLVSDWATTAK